MLRVFPGRRECLAALDRPDRAHIAKDEEGPLTDEKTPAAPVDNAYTQWHEVKKGETLGKIAEQHYGDPSLYRKIFEANRDTIKNPDLIQVGWKLRIP
jgi:nucleoid-associated protein YgaU